MEWKGYYLRLYDIILFKPGKDFLDIQYIMVFTSWHHLKLSGKAVAHDRDQVLLVAQGGHGHHDDHGEGLDHRLLYGGPAPQVHQDEPIGKI